MAVGLAVALVALGAYVTVRMSLESSLDSSLRDRAHQAAGSLQIAQLTDSDVPSWATGAADVRIYLVTANGTPLTTDRLNPQIPLDGHETAVAKGVSASSARTVSANGNDYRVIAVPYLGSSGYALVLAQNMAPQERVLQKMGAVMLLFGLAGVIGAAFAGWAVARNGLRPVRRLTRQRRGDHAHRGPHSAPDRGRRRDRTPRDGVQRDARGPLRLARPPAPTRRRRGARAADAAHVAAHQPRPAAPVGRRRRTRPRCAR